MKEKEKLTWEEIENFLEKELKKTKSIMTFGTIGSLNIEHDIDTIITKKPNTKTSNFYKEIHDLFDNLDSYLHKNYNIQLTRISRTSDEVFCKYLSANKMNNIIFHTMIYTSYSQIVKDWSWALHPDISLTNILDKTNFLLGKREDLNSVSFGKEFFYDAEFIYLYYEDYLQFNLPENILVELMNKLFEGAYKKRLGLKTPTVRNRNEAKKYFYELCDVLDGLSKK